MKNRIILGTLAAATLLFSACETDRESNPTLTVPDSFVLNEPLLSDGVYYLDDAKDRYVEMSCTQPEYGYTAPVKYSVEVSMTEDFADLQTLSTSYTTAKMDVVANEIAFAMTNMQIKAGKLEADFPMELPVYVRLKADLESADATVRSNSVKLNTHLEFSMPPIEYPESMYIMGSICDWNWDQAFEMVPVYASKDGEYGGSFWRLVYFAAGAEFKINSATSWNGSEVGFGGLEIEDNASANITDKGGNFAVGNGGWYLVMVKTVINDVKLRLDYYMSFNKPNVYLFGATNGGDDTTAWAANDAYLFTVPADASGDFVSNAFVKGGEIRACVNLPATDWWKSEFIVIDKVLKYRGTGTDQQRVSGAAGQKIYINFTNATGKVE